MESLVTIAICGLMFLIPEVRKILWDFFNPKGNDNG